ncbi:LysM domain-containing protein [Neolewinella agarilytica]|uniref:LysM domain-containing protein n=2 Tax=Neolewinella agarilytica TaxID=478744 RepID=A0A1H9MRI2_9BACT|nr:LysM domain-containing protein [Neolewinella agarilytica]
MTLFIPFFAICLRVQVWILRRFAANFFRMLSNTQRYTTNTVFLFLTVLLSFGGPDLQAQCPPFQKEGIHVFQADDRLEDLAERYGISQEKILQWNKLQKGQKIPDCKRLIVSSEWVVDNTQEEDSPASKEEVADKEGFQQGVFHKVMPGESLLNIADIYGLSLEELRTMNDIPSGAIIQAGSVIRKSWENTSPERVAVPEMVVREVKPAPAEGQTAKGGGIIMKEKPEVSATPASSAAAAKKPAEESFRTEMSLQESALLAEVNLMRSDPRRYSKFVKDYVKSRRKDKMNKYKVNPRDVKSVMDRLKNTPALPLLVSNECLYWSAQKHGAYLLKNNRFSHQGIGRLEPHERTAADCREVKLSTERDEEGRIIGNENLGVGADARQAIIRLLIDEGSDVAGHRNTLLGKEWRYMVAHYFGSVKGYQDCFVQVFGK